MLVRMPMLVLMRTLVRTPTLVRMVVARACSSSCQGASARLPAARAQSSRAAPGAQPPWFLTGSRTHARVGAAAAAEQSSSSHLLSSSSSSLVILVCIVLPFLLPADCFTICLPPVFNALVNGWLLCWLPPTPQMTSAKSIDDRCTCHRRSSPSSSSSLLVASHQREDRPCGGLRMMTTAIATTKATDRPLNRQSPSHLVDVNITSSSPPHVGCFHPFSLCWWRRLFGMPTEVAPMPSRWQCVVAAGCSCA